MPRGPRLRAIDCARIRCAAFDGAKAAKFATPRHAAVFPVTTVAPPPMAGARTAAFNLSGADSQLPRDLRRSDRGADLEEETMRLAELALVGGFVAGKPCQCGTLEVHVWLEPPCAGFPDQGECALQRELDRRSRDQALGTPADARHR